MKHEKQVEYLKRIQSLRLIDDDFMNVCFDKNIEATELLLRIILDKPDINVLDVSTQDLKKNLVGRDIKLDISADDSKGIKYNIEVQRADKGASLKRARYHSSILDASNLEPGQDFSELPETYVVFITENDVLKKKLPLYTIDRRINETDEIFDDGEHIIYVNGEDRYNSTELSKLMHDFFCTDPNDMNFKVLADKVRYFKEDTRGIRTMCKIFEDFAAETAEQTKIELATDMIKDGKLPLYQIAQYAKLPIEQVQEIAASAAQ